MRRKRKIWRNHHNSVAKTLPPEMANAHDWAKDELTGIVEAELQASHQARHRHRHTEAQADKDLAAARRGLDHVGRGQRRQQADAKQRRKCSPPRAWRRCGSSSRSARRPRALPAAAAPSKGSRKSSATARHVARRREDDGAAEGGQGVGQRDPGDSVEVGEVAADGVPGRGDDGGVKGKGGGRGRDWRESVSAHSVSGCQGRLVGARASSVAVCRLLKPLDRIVRPAWYTRLQGAIWASRIQLITRWPRQFCILPLHCHLRDS